MMVAVSIDAKAKAPVRAADEDRWSDPMHRVNNPDGAIPNSERISGAYRRLTRADDSQASIRFAVGECSLGAVLVAVTEQGVRAILLGDDPDALVRDLRNRFAEAQAIDAGKDLERLVSKVVGFIEAPARGLDLKLDVRGTAFQRRVWHALREVPAGATASYADIAARIGAPKAVRAVARACGANAIAVAIPCHRIVRNDGAISGYRWGVARKRTLLDREAAT